MITHSAAAQRIAQILIPEGIDSKGRASKINTAYGAKTREGIAALIDNETHASDLLGALIRAVAYLDANRPKGKIADIFSKLNELENDVLKPARAAIAKATA